MIRFWLKVENKMGLLEKEKKFLLSKIEKNDIWDKEFIVYQWYEEVSNNKSIKFKIIFDLLKLRRIIVRVTKIKIDSFTWDKRIEYLKFEDIDLDKYLGVGFVVKRRAIRKNIFLDCFYRNNGICKYLLEIEEDGSVEEARQLGLAIAEEVTEDERYLNANMCVPFTKEDYDVLKYLLFMIPGLNG